MKGRLSLYEHAGINAVACTRSPSFVTGVFGQTSPMSDSQKIEYLMQLQKPQAQVKELVAAQQQEVVSTPKEAETSRMGEL